MKKIIIITILLIGIISLTGCGKKSDVIIYSSMEEERNQELTKQLKPFFSVRFDKRKNNISSQKGYYNLSLKQLIEREFSFGTKQYSMRDFGILIKVNKNYIINYIILHRRGNYGKRVQSA